MTIAYVQEFHSDQVSRASGYALTPNGINSVANNKLIFVGCMSGTPSTVSITDSLSQTWTKELQVDDDGVGGIGIVIFTCSNPSALKHTDTATVTCTGATWKGMWIQEFSGLATSGKDKTHTDQDTNDDGSGNLSCGPTATTSQADELVIAVFGATTGSFGTTFTKGTGYSDVSTPTHICGSVFQSGMEYKIVSSTGAQTATGSTNNSGFVLNQMILTYKAAPPAALQTKPNVVSQAVQRMATRATMIRREWRRTPNGILVPELTLG